MTATRLLTHTRSTLLFVALLFAPCFTGRSVAAQPPTSVTVSPAAPTANPGDPVTFTATTDADPAPTYQWLLNGFPIAGATSRSLTLYNVAVTDAGRFSVRAVNPLGAAESSAAELVVNAPRLGLLNLFPKSRLDFLTGTPTANTGSTNFTKATSGHGWGDNRAANLDSGETQPYPGSAKRTLWFFWQAVTDGVVTFTTDGSAVSTAMAAWLADSNTNLWMITQDCGSSGYGTSKIMFSAEAGRGYAIQLDSMVKNVFGRLVLNWDFVPSSSTLPRVLVPPQDTALNRGQDLTLSAQLSGNNAGVNLQWFWEDQAIANATNTSLLVPNMQDAFVGQFRLRLETAGFSWFSTPAEVQVNTDGWGNLIAEAILCTKSSTGLVGWNILAGTPLNPPPPPAGLRRRITGVTGYSGTQIFNTRAGKDPTEPNHCGLVGGSSYWLSYAAPNTGVMRLDTAGSTYDTILAVYVDDGSNMGYASLVPVACDNNSGADGLTSSLQFNTTNGVTYYIVVDGVNGAYGTAYFNYSLKALPTISPLSPLTLAEDTLSGVTNFTVGDFETPAANLVVTATSSNPALVPTGNILLGGSGSARTFQVRPATNANGTCTITVTVTDADGLTASSAFTLTVTPVNDAPVAGTDTYYRVANGNFTVPIANVRANDTDVDGDTLTLTNVASFSFLGARITKTSTTITYTAKVGANGADYFTYTISDGRGGTATGRINVYVLP